MHPAITVHPKLLPTDPKPPLSILLLPYNYKWLISNFGYTCVGWVGFTVIIRPVSVSNWTGTELANLNWAWQFLVSDLVLKFRLEKFQSRTQSPNWHFLVLKLTQEIWVSDLVSKLRIWKFLSRSRSWDSKKLSPGLGLKIKTKNSSHGLGLKTETQKISV